MQRLIGKFEFNLQRKEIVTLYCNSRVTKHTAISIGVSLLVLQNKPDIGLFIGKTHAVGCALQHHIELN